ncbi:hypothetical protein [Chryseobacterium gambrini]|uniref:Uncharacterized protein n=1 Tax=Chryseobacterium gambrini TaxID=373672 RepID=A0A1N7QWS9_9FLAO|nr:hypothetical protein [Chryseobacterium gambrini]SIT27322.1 hypothetical protein SAMN05421785_12115 [Chryseobacterium gambrini]
MRIRTYIRRIKNKIRNFDWKVLFSSNSLSFIAILLSIITFYFQFFNTKHEVFYSFLTPDYNNNNDTIIIPVFYKNTGNQTELILDANLILEVKTEDNQNYYRRIGDNNKSKFPIILNMNENKYINLTSNYQDYLFGSLEIEPTGNNFRDFTILDSLKLKMTTQFLTQNGNLSNDTIDIGYVTFKKNKISQLDYNSVQLKKLNLNSNIQMTGGSKISYTITSKVDLKDPKDVEKNKAMLKYIRKTINDSTLNKIIK